MKLINGWYNIHDFNDQCCGQLKVAIIPSQPMSPSKSSKYFKKHNIVEPCNLHLALYNSKPVSSSPVSNLKGGAGESSTSLFEQLRQNLKDLEKMTHDIKTRSLKSTSENEPVVVLQDEGISGDASRESTNERYSKEDVFSPQIIQIEVDQNSTESDNRSNISSLHDSPLPILDDVEELNTEFEYPERDDSARLCRNVSGEPSVRDSSDSSQDENIVDDGCCGDGDLNDSTDDLLEHLREFERKYKHLKNIVQNDSDFECDDDLDVISSPAFTSPRDALRSQKSTVYAEGSIGDSFFDQVVNVSSGEPSKEDIKINEHDTYSDAAKDRSNESQHRDSEKSSCNSRSIITVKFSLISFSAKITFKANHSLKHGVYQK